MKRIPRPSPSRGALVALLVLFLVGAGSATAAKLVTSAQIKNGTIRAVDVNKQYRQQLDAWFAKVDGTGQLLAGRHVTAVSRTATGDFLVTFNRSVEKCALVASVRGTADNTFYGFVTTYSPGGNVARVVVRDPNGNPADGAGFNLVSSC